ncbi:MAG: TonB-dependent receptor [Bacteroidetes bacterium]|nr:TonB-dependent receptor [Bacteroidota bacterium]
MKYICTILVVMLFTTKAYTQSNQTVRGVVIEKDTKQPIEGALIKILTTNFEAKSDAQGSFKIINIPIGRYDIEISQSGYSLIILNNIIISSAKENILTIEMDEIPTQLKEFKMKGKAKTGQVNNEMSTVSSRLFTVDETDRFAGSRGDPARMASNFAGVQGADDSRNDIVVRGNSPQGVLWRLEGVDIPNPNHFAIPGTTGGSVSIINNKILANSDFFTGAFPAEYGNSISGVFDLKMRNGNNEKYEFSSQVGILGWDLMAEGPFSKKSKASFLFTYKYSTLKMFNALHIPIGTDAIPQYQDASFRINIPGKKSNFAIYGIGGSSEINILISNQKKKTQNLYGDNDRDQYFKSKMGVFGTTWQYKIDKKSYLKAALTYSGSSVNAHHELVYRHTRISGNDTLYVLDSLLPNMNYAFNQSSFNAHIYIQQKLNSRWTLKYGIIAQQNIYNYTDSTIDFDSTSSTYKKWFTRWNTKDNPILIQLYAQAKYILNQKTTINFGLHSQYYSRGNAYSVIEPRIGIKYQLNKSQSLSFGTGIHSQIQSPYTYYYILPNNTSPHNLNMGMTKSSHFVLGYDKMLSNAKRIKIETYYQYLWNIPVNNTPTAFSLANTGSGFSRFFPDTLVNKGTAYNYGIEFTFEKFFSKGYYYLIFFVE